MSIQEKRAQILELIERVNRQQRRNPSVRTPVDHPPTIEGPHRRSGAQPSASPTRRAQLAALVEKRRHIETTRANRVLDALERLETRIARIEEALSANPGAAATSDHIIGGQLKDGLLSDLLQLVSSNALTGTFAVDDGTGEIRLFFGDGEITHAEGPNVVGESAVFALMAREQGRYYFRETAAAPHERTVHSKTQFLILEALRRIDENRARS